MRGQSGTLVRFVHPRAGALTLHRERMTIGGTDGLMLVTDHPAPASADADRLAVLLSDARMADATAR